MEMICMDVVRGELRFADVGFAYGHGRPPALEAEKGEGLHMPSLPKTSRGEQGGGDDRPLPSPPVNPNLDHDFSP